MKKKFDEVYNLLENNQISPYNFYNIDISTDQYYSNLHYSKNKYDNIDNKQKLSKCFLDIEVFMNNEEGVTIPMMLQSGKYLVNAVTHYYSNENKYYLYCILPPGSNLTENEVKEYCLKESRKKFFIRHDEKTNTDIYDTYIQEDQDLEVVFYKDIDLVVALWNKIKSNDPSILSSFNGDFFDFPYLYQNLFYHYGSHQEVANIMSRFNSIKLEKTRDRAGNDVNWIRFTEFILMDMMYLYKDRSDK